MASPYFRTLLKPCWLQTNNFQPETNEPLKIEINLPDGTSLDTFQTLMQLIYGENVQTLIECLDIKNLMSLTMLSNHYLIKPLTQKLCALI
jgi:hypothetical protein